ncbi:MAG TPA: alanine racemase [Bacteroidales bacterium]
MLSQPTLIISHKKVEANIDRMLAKIVPGRTIFRPHFKTHQSVEVGNIFRKKGVSKITVSSVSMAEFFIDAGWKDITIAFPVNLREIEKINILASRIQLNLLVESEYSAQFLLEKIKNKVGVFIKIDTGYHRTGLLPENKTEIDKIVSVFSKSKYIDFKGFLTHAGNTYSAKGKAEILSIINDARDKLNSLKHQFIGSFPNIITSYGDTPSCSLADNFDGFDEIRPGNFAYYDVMQYHIGSCSLNEIAVAVVCPVVAVHPERNELVIYGGSVHFSKELIAADNGFNLFGYVVKLEKNTWSEPIAGAYVSALSQEHGIVKMPSPVINQTKPGDIIGILPIHSCLTADCLKENQVII